VSRKIEKAGERLELVLGHARFAGERTVEVGGRRYQGRSVVINVGCRPAVPKVSGLDQVGFLDNRTVMELRTVPRRLLVLGGGYIGCEFGQMFRRFGAEVTVIDRNGHLLPREDPEVSAELEAVFRKEGIALEQHATVEGVGREGDDIVVALGGGRTVSGSHLLVAVGREPNTGDLGCADAGVKVDERGFIPVDDDFRTSASGVYAVGDVTGGPQFTHTSWDDHRLLFERLMGRTAHGRAGRVIPYTGFTDPQVAGVGLTEKEAKAKGVSYELASMPFRYIARAIELDEQAGVLRVLIDPKTEKVLGASIVGAEAGELIHIFAALMQAGAPARAIVDMEAVHPTFAEGVQSAVMTLPRYALA
jgi:pyruvate/2-oxoglutarate dehydrogenase complex dihydrolipoamide dehydrogenase (E3) component